MLVFTPDPTVELPTVLKVPVVWNFTNTMITITITTTITITIVITITMTITITITKVPVAWHYKDGFTVQVIKLIINRATSWKETNKNSGTNYMWINIFCGFFKQKQH